MVSFIGKRSLECGHEYITDSTTITDSNKCFALTILSRVL